MRVRLRGINRVTKRLADGTQRTYWYAWKGGPPLHGEPGSPEFVANYNEAVSRKVAPPRGTLLSLLQQYQASEDFCVLDSSTRRSYVALITRLEKRFGNFPLSALTDRRSRGIFMGWRDQLAASAGRRQADYAWTVLARVLSWSFNRGLVAANPCERGGRLYRGGGRAEKIWTGPAALHAFDLRGTAVTRLALAGCTEAEIATITGHSLRGVRAILDSHYLSRDPALGESAIRKLEKGTKSPTDQLTSQLVRDVLMPKREKPSEINGGRTRTRTLDPLIKSHQVS